MVLVSTFLAVIRAYKVFITNGLKKINSSAYSTHKFLGELQYFLTIDFAVLSVICFFQDISGLNRKINHFNKEKIVAEKTNDEYYNKDY